MICKRCGAAPVIGHDRTCAACWAVLEVIARQRQALRADRAWWSSLEAQPWWDTAYVGSQVRDAEDS